MSGAGKRQSRNSVIFIVVLVALVITYLVCIQSFQTVEYIGKSSFLLELNSSKTMLIGPSDSPVELVDARSNKPFTLRSDEGDVINGIPPATSVNEREIFIAQPDVLQSGLWYIDYGNNILVIIRCSKPINVTVASTEVAWATLHSIVWGSMFVVGLVWVIDLSQKDSR